MGYKAILCILINDKKKSKVKNKGRSKKTNSLRK